MTMRLTLTLPTTAADLQAFADLCDDVGLNAIELDLGYGDTNLLSAYRCVVETPTAPPAEPAPAKPAKVAKRAADRAPAKKAVVARKGTGKAAAGTVALSILTALVDADGMIDGSYADVARTAYPDKPQVAQTEIRKMEMATWIAAERVNNRVQRVAITTKGREVYARLTDGPQPEQTPANVTPLPQPAPQRTGHPALPRPAAPTTPPAGGLKPPSGGWA